MLGNYCEIMHVHWVAQGDSQFIPTLNFKPEVQPLTNEFVAIETGTQFVVWNFRVLVV